MEPYKMRLIESGVCYGILEQKHNTNLIVQFVIFGIFAFNTNFILFVFLEKDFNKSYIFIKYRAVERN